MRSRFVWGFVFRFFRELFGDLFFFAVCLGSLGFRDLFFCLICLGILGLIWSRFVLGFVDFSSRFVWGFLLSFLRDLFGDLRISGFAFLAICAGILGFGDFFHDWFGDFGICFFFARFVWGCGDLALFSRFVQGFWDLEICCDLFGDLGGFGDLFVSICLATLGICFFLRFVWGFGDLRDLFGSCFFHDLFGDLGIRALFSAICLGFEMVRDLLGICFSFLRELFGDLWICLAICA